MPNPYAWRKPLKHGGLRVMVCGGRDYEDRDAVFRALDKIRTKHGVVCLISGCARGADTLGIEWAEARGVPVARFPVSPHEWHTYGKAAGHLRNGKMIREGCPDICVHFPGGRGTANALEQCYDHGVLRYNPITNEVT